MNPKKSKAVKFTYKRKTEEYSIILAGEEVPQVETVEYLGLSLDTKLTWNTHITSLIQRLRHRLHQLKYLIKGTSPLPLQHKRTIYFSLIRPIWMYGSSIWSSASNSQIQRVQTLQNRVLRIIADAPWYVRNTTLHSDLAVPTVASTLHTCYRRLFRSFTNHPNSLLNQIPLHMPLQREHRRLKRKRHSDLADDI